MTSSSKERSPRVYILLEGVKASGAQASATFTKKSFDLKIMGYKGKDYR